MRPTSSHQIRIGKRRVDYRVVRSAAAKKRRLRVGPAGVEIVQPASWRGEDATAFLARNQNWLIAQLERVERFRHVRRAEQVEAGEILFRGEPTTLRIEATPTTARGNRVRFEPGEIVIRHGPASSTPLARSLENWLRRQARDAIEEHLAEVTEAIAQRPERVYVMGQRTKWGSCSARRNLSFNWRLILAPEFVLRYLVTHEAVHLAVPDHSAKFWLTVQSLFPEMERAKQWLCRHHDRLAVDLGTALSEAPSGRRDTRASQGQ